MTRDAFVTPTRAALAAGAALALTATVPALAAAPSGGASAPSASTAGSTTQSTGTAPAPAPERAARPRIAVRTQRGSGLVGRNVVYAGRVARHTRGQRLRLEIRSSDGWHVVDRVRVKGDGSYRVSARINRMGGRAARLRIVSQARRPGDTLRVARVHGFRRAVASYYGPGLYGGALACGGTLTPGTIGVAHKTLPCGTKLTLRVGGRQVVARVVDRGPYVGNREFDLTAATKYRLGFGSTGTVLVDR
jgi:rare lipoprotein A